MRADTIMARASRGEPLRDVAIIDAHAHLGVSQRVHTNAGDAEGLLVSMDRIGIRRTCLSSLQAIAGDTRRGNDAVAEAVRRFPSRFVGYGVVNPNEPEAVAGELRRCLDDLGLWAIKLHPSWHGYSADGPAYLPVWQELNARGGTVLSHTFGPLRALRELCGRYPRVTFIAAHLGGSYEGRQPDELPRLLREVPNLYVDLSSSVVPYGGIEALVAAAGAERLLYGSDAPYGDSAHQLGRITHAEISEVDKRSILGGNMARLLGGIAPA